MGEPVDFKALALDLANAVGKAAPGGGREAKEVAEALIANDRRRAEEKPVAFVLREAIASASYQYAQTADLGARCHPREDELSAAFADAHRILTSPGPDIAPAELRARLADLNISIGLPNA